MRNRVPLNRAQSLAKEGTKNGAKECLFLPKFCFSFLFILWFHEINFLGGIIMTTSKIYWLPICSMLYA